MTDDAAAGPISAPKQPTPVKIAAAKGRPMLSWVGKRPLREVRAFPAQLIERFGASGGAEGAIGPSADVDWSDWPDRYERGGLLFHGDNKEVLAHLLANGFRGKVDLVYIDPPFDSGADYVRRVQLRGASGTARLDGETYTLGEQIQYTDIWANDTYLQFMYERLLLLKELLSQTGSIFLHCDTARGHQLRVLMDEVFGPEKFLNEIVWSYRRWPSDTDAYQSMHDTILYYVSRGGGHTFHRRYEDASESYMKRFGGMTQRLDEETGTRKITSDEATRGMPLRDVWDISIIAGFKHERTGFPTQKPEELLNRIIEGSSSPGNLVLDCFVGSGTTAAVAQKLGRRWIGADINKGAIQTSAKRLAGVIEEQVAASATAQQKAFKTDDDAAPPHPAQSAFATWRVNDYDLAIQHNEAVNLACEHLGVQRTKTDPFFDGSLGKKLVKIVAFNHPVTVLDLQDASRELESRPDEARDAVLVALGREMSTEQWLADWNRNRPINKLEIIELRSDPKYGKFFEHRPASARVRLDGSRVVIDDFISPSILERLASQEGVLAPQVTDWRSMVDSVMIDPAHDGDVFNIVVADIPERKSDLVAGTYDLDLPDNASVPVAVKVTDMLGEEVLVLLDR